jgi:hypothetical protein
MALAMVLAVVAAGAILAWGMIAAGSTRVAIARTTAQQAQAANLAESGLHIGVYYLKNRPVSPIVYGTSGNVHYPGENNVSITGMEGTVNIAVDNPANGQFVITSTAHLHNTTATARASLKITRERQATYGAYLAGNVKPTSRTTLTGGFISNGTYSSTTGAVVSGTLTTSTTGSATDRAATNFAYPISALQYLPTYFYNGKTYSANVLSSNYTGQVLVGSAANNPLNIWYVDRSISIKLPLTIIDGTLITAPGTSLSAEANITVTQTRPFPALVIGRELAYTKDNVIVTANGPAYVGEIVRTRGVVGNNCSFRVNGSFMSAGGGLPFHSTYRGTVLINFVADKAKHTGFADEIEPIKSVEVIQWQTDLRLP